MPGGLDRLLHLADDNPACQDLIAVAGNSRAPYSTALPGFGPGRTAIIRSPEVFEAIKEVKGKGTGAHQC